MIRIRLIGLFVVALVSAVSSSFAGPETKRRAKGSFKKRDRKSPTTIDEKLQSLILKNMTSAEIAVGTGCSVRAIEERRRKLNKTNKLNKANEPRPKSGRYAKVDEGIDAFYSLTSMLENRYTISPTNVRAWFIGRSDYLEEQRPAQLLGAGEFELVREAAIAYATNETPNEFRDRIGTIVRVHDPLGI
jgi:hypothetical protein